MATEKEYLNELTKAVCKAVNRLNEALSEEDTKRRYKLGRRALQELEIFNDEVMRSALGLTVSRIAQLKMSRHSSAKPAKAKGGEPRQLSPFHTLMAHHAKHLIGPIPDAGAQGSAIQWILQYFTPELAIKKYDAQLQEAWRKGRVSWLTVRQEVGMLRVERTPDEAREADAGKWAREVEETHGIKVSNDVGVH